MRTYGDQIRILTAPEVRRDDNETGPHVFSSAGAVGTDERGLSRLSSAPGTPKPGRPSTPQRGARGGSSPRPAYLAFKGDF